MFSTLLHKVRRELSSCCVYALVVVKFSLDGYMVFPMVMGVGTLVSGSDDVPKGWSDVWVVLSVSLN